MIRFALLPLLAALAGPVSAAADGGAILQAQCAGCHRLKGPAPQTVQQLWERKGPDLFYAGDKYQAQWLAAWLSNPRRIRPAGEFYQDHIKRGAESDQVDETTLAPHPALAPADAQACAQALVQFKLEQPPAMPAVEAGSISKTMGEMVFDKFLGCLACHQIEPGYGGMSGPELYTVARRLKPEFIASYIRSPQAWDPRIWMPDKHVSEANVQKLVHYFETLAKESGDAR